MALKRPQYTQIPNDLLDKYMPGMSKSELKLILTIARYTLGYHREKHVLSLSFLQKKTGLNRTVISAGIKSLIEQDLIEKRSAGKSHAYCLKFDDLDSTEIVLPEPGSTEIVLSNGTETVLVDSTEIVPNKRKVLKKVYKENTTTTNGDGQQQQQQPEPSAPVQEETANDVPIGVVYSTYEDNLGTLSPIISETIGDDFDTYGGRWLVDAIQIAVENNVLKWNYVQGILRRWKTEGRGDRKTSASVGYSNMKWS